MSGYYAGMGGLPPQDRLMTGRAIFTEAYCFIPKGVMSDIVTSLFPGWDKTHGWMIARPMSGFSETFSQYIMDVAPGGGSDAPEPDAGVEGVIFVVEGELALTYGGMTHAMSAGGYAYLPPGLKWTLRNPGHGPARFHWVRKLYETAPGVDIPEAFVTNEREIEISWMPDTGERWGTTRFVSPSDIRHDMHVNIVTLRPGARIPFEETHVMEHGLYVLEGQAVYKLNTDWVEVEPGDFMWLRAFCPQACYAAGDRPFRYLLYKDVNRHARLRRF